MGLPNAEGALVIFANVIILKGLLFTVLQECDSKEVLPRIVEGHDSKCIGWLK